MSLGMLHALAPQFLAWLPLAALPVLFHLFLRLRRQTRVFPSLMFFLAADPHLHARRKVREWLVLALRVLAITLLIAALARPQWRGTGGSGEVAVALVLDNSASMATADAEGRTRLQRALAAARAVLEDPAVRRVGIATTVADTALVLPEGLVGDPAVWRAALEAVRTTHAAGRPAVALSRAAGWLARELAAQAELHVFTDAQSGEWTDAGGPFALPPSVRLVVHRIGTGTETAGEVAIEALERPDRIPVAGRDYPLQVMLRNYAMQPREVVLCLSLGSTEPVRRALRVPADARFRVPVPVRPEAGRDLQVRVWLEGAAASPAAQGWLTAQVSSGLPAWIAGRPEESGLLPEALSPGGDAALSGVLAVAVDAGRLREAPSESPALVALCGFLEIPPEGKLALRAYVEQGGVLLVAPGALDGRIVLPAWCGIEAEPVALHPGGVSLAAASPDSLFWSDLRSTGGAVALPSLLALRRLRLRSPDARPLLIDPEGDPVLVERQFGKGRMVVSGIAWASKWSDLPRRGAFLAMVQTLALAGRSPSPVLRAGDEAGWRAVLGSVGVTNGHETLRLEGVAGTALRLEGAAVLESAPAHAGLYRVSHAGRHVSFGVLGDASEAGRPLPDLARTPWPAGSAAQVIRHRNAIETAEAVRRGRRGRSLFALFASLAMISALAECRLAQRILPAGRQGQPSSAQTKGGGHAR